MDCSLRDSSVHGIQARTLERVAISSFRGIFPTQGLNPHLRSPALVGRFFTTSTTWEAFLGYSDPNSVGQDGASPSREGGTSNSHRHPSEAGLWWALDPQGGSQWEGEVAGRQCSRSVTEELCGLRHWILREGHSGEGRWQEGSAVGQLLRSSEG